MGDNGSGSWFLTDREIHERQKLAKKACAAIFLSFAILTGTSLCSHAQETVFDTMIFNQSLHDWENRQDNKASSAEPKRIPISPVAEVAETTCRFDVPEGWTRIGPGTVEGSDGNRISVFCSAGMPSDARDAEHWLTRRARVLFADEEIVKADRDPQWRSLEGDKQGVWTWRLDTVRSDGFNYNNLLQAHVTPHAVRLYVRSSRDDDHHEQRQSAIEAGLTSILKTLDVQQIRKSLDGNPVTFKLPENVIELPGVSWDLIPGMKPSPQTGACAWRCTTFGPDPKIIVHEPLPLAPRAAIETLVAAWPDSVVDRITAPMLHHWFDGTDLSAELLHESLRDHDLSFSYSNMLIPLTDGARTVLVEIRGDEAEIFDRLPTVIAFTESIRIDAP